MIRSLNIILRVDLRTLLSYTMINPGILSFLTQNQKSLLQTRTIGGFDSFICSFFWSEKRVGIGNLDRLDCDLGDDFTGTWPLVIVVLLIPSESLIQHSSLVVKLDGQDYNT